jgi:Sec-independent protein translocase protein TatA
VRGILLISIIMLVIFGAGNLTQLSEGSATPSNKGFKKSEHDAEAEAMQHSADPPMVVSECIKNK